MIVSENGWLVVQFDDWTPAMMGLAYVLSKLPVRPEMRPELMHAYPVGIERLRDLGGDDAVYALYELACDLEYRPDQHELLDLGKAVIGVDRELRSVGRRTRARRYAKSRGTR